MSKTGRIVTNRRRDKNLPKVAGDTQTHKHMPGGDLD